MADFIRLKNMVFFAYHGVKEGEVQNGQRFEVDVELEADLKLAAMHDDLELTYDYEVIYDIVQKTVNGTRFNLIEALAEEICNRILMVYPKIIITITIRKPHVAVSGVLDTAEVSIKRSLIKQ